MLFQSKDQFAQNFESASQFAPAFEPHELQIGSIVFACLKRAGIGYLKNVDDARPMLVTGLWRQGQDIKKIELFKFTSRPAKKQYPDDLELDTTLIFRSGAPQRSRLMMHETYLLDNAAEIFPLSNNTDEISMTNELWFDITVRRAQAILFNPAASFSGEIDDTLEREGFFFPTLPNSAVRSEAFVPEVNCKHFACKPCDLISKDDIDEIVDFAVRYDAHKRVSGEGRFYAIPFYEDWPMDLPQVRFPKWWGDDGPSPQLP